MKEQVLGDLIIQNEEKEKNDIQNQMILQEIGVKKIMSGEIVETQEIKKEVGEEIIEGTVEIIVVIEEMIEGVQNDDTATITLSTSSSVKSGNTGIDTISSQSCSVNCNAPFLPCGWFENTG